MDTEKQKYNRVAWRLFRPAIRPQVLFLATIALYCFCDFHLFPPGVMDPARKGVVRTLFAAQVRLDPLL